MTDCIQMADLAHATEGDAVEEVAPLRLGKAYNEECFDAVQGTVVPLAVAHPKEYWRRVYELYASSTAIILGNILEWYDWTVYAYMEDVLQEIFFEGSNLGAWLVFAVSFLARPVGSYLFGWGADVFGRAIALKVAIWGMAIATVGQGCLFPWGQSAVFVLAAFRVVSGFSAGGESAGVNIYVSESGSSDQDQILVAAVGINNVSGSLAFFLATISSLAVHQLPRAQLVSWGWRLPFLMAAPLSAVAIKFRGQLSETREFEEAISSVEATQSSSQNDQHLVRCWPEIGMDMRCILLVIGVLSGIITCNYFPVYVVSWLHNHARFSTNSALLIASSSKFIQMLMSFPVSFVGDRYGVTLTMLIGGLLTAPSIIIVLLIVIMEAPVEDRPSSVSLLPAFLALGLWLPIATSIYLVPAMLYVTSLFPVQRRGRGAGISYGLAACVGGALPAISTTLAKKSSIMPGVYVALLCVPSLLLLAWSRHAHRRGWLTVFQRDWLF